MRTPKTRLLRALGVQGGTSRGRDGLNHDNFASVVSPGGRNLHAISQKCFLCQALHYDIYSEDSRKIRYYIF